MDQNEFSNPGPEYRGVALWMLNDRLEKEEVVRQLDGMCAAGWGAVIGRTFNGLLTQYLSDEWMDITRAIIERAGQKGMKVWLQAGYMPSGIPDLPDEQKHRVLCRKPRGQAPEEGEVLVCEDDDYCYYQGPQGTVLDLLNPEAVRQYLDKAYQEPWGRRFADQFGRTVEAIWVDEPHFRPPLLPWSDRLPALFREQWGYSIEDHIPSLFSMSGDAHRVRHHYWRVVLDMFVEAYFEQVGRWCRERGVKFTGHLMGEDSLHGQISWTAAVMPGYVHMQLPGIDHLTGNMTWPTGKRFIMTPKQCSSAANQLGRVERLAEMYGVSSQGLDFERRKWIAEWLICLGINYRCYHGAFYSLRGRRKRIYPPHLSYQQPWWPDNRTIADYFARLCYAMRQGRYCADVLVLHPVESAWCVYDPTYTKDVHDRVHEPEEIKRLNDHFADLSENLLKIHRGFDYGDEYLMARHGKVTAGGLTVGEMTYKVVIIPSVITLRRTTVELLDRFIASGGTVLSTGELPTRIDGESDAGIADVNARIRPVENDPAALKEALDALVPPTVEVKAASGDSRDVWVHERRLDGSRLLFLTNSSLDEGVRAEVRMRGVGRLRRCDLLSGRLEDVPQRWDGQHVVTCVSLPPAGSCLLELDERAAPEDVPEPSRTVVETRALPDDYRVRRLSPNALTLDHCRLRKGGGEWTERLPVILIQERLEAEGYEGPVQLLFEFVAETKPASIQVVIEDAAEYRIRVNGRPVRYAGLPYYVDRSFHPVDITDLVKVGENVIELARDFQPMPRTSFRLASLFEARKGVELESVYLVGDFAVKATRSPDPPKPDCIRLSPKMALADERGISSGELVLEGYPFFVGRVALTQAVDLRAPAGGERVLLRLPTLDAALAKVRVNGHEAGAILWKPYELDITPLVQEGRNEIELELVTTLRNLLGPHHRLSDEYDTWSHSYSGLWPSGPDWYENRHSDNVDWTDDYFVFPLGFRGGLTVEYVAVE